MMQYNAAESLTGVFFKSAYDAFNFENNVLTKITDADYPGWSTVTPTSITRSGSTATVTLPSAVNWESGATATVAGAAETEYNGDFVISVTDSTHFTYTVTGTPATPATGTITISVAHNCSGDCLSRLVFLCHGHQCRDLQLGTERSGRRGMRSTLSRQRKNLAQAWRWRSRRAM